MSSVAHIIRRKRERKARQRAQRQRSQIWMLVIFVITVLLVVVPVGVIFGVAGLLYFQAVNAMPTPAETIYLDPIVGATHLYDRSGQTLIYSVEDPLGNQRRWIELDALPDYVISATLLMEDPDYLRTTGFDLVQTMTRLWRYILDAPVSPDRSITGRLVRNAVLPPARQSGLDDELLEIALISEAERQFSPEDLLEWHLNTNYYGNDAYGIDAAAQVYLGKSATDLSLDEAALLVAIAPAPRFNPFDNEVAARGRQSDLLHNMFNNGLINEPQFDQASSVVTRLRTDLIQVPLIAPDFSIYARQQAQDILDNLNMDGARLVSRSGLEIVTTLDLDLYYQSDCALRAHLDRLNGGLGNVLSQDGAPCAAVNYLVQPFGADSLSPPDNGTLMMMNVKTGEIYSIVGDARSQNKQPGLILHPFVYFEGFLRRLFTPASMVYDLPRAFPGPADGLIYTPSNPDGRFRGPLNLRDAMAAGLLPPAVYVADSRGLTQVLRSAHLIGINSLDENSYDLSLLARGGNVSVLDATYAYSVFGAMGTMHGVDVDPIAQGYRVRNPVAVLQIKDAEGNVLWQYDEERRQFSQTIILEPSLAYLINDILGDDTTRQRVLNTQDEMLQLTRPSAVVNGLTADKRDSWTIGYTPNLIVGVHLGRDDNSGMSLDNYGRQGSAPLWRALMNYAHDRDGIPPDDWQRPADIETSVVCNISGLIPQGNNPCPTRTEIFPPNSPLLADTYWQAVEVNTQTGQLATANTPPNLRAENIYFVPPLDLMEWWVESGQPLPPTDYDTISRPEVLKAVQILEPADFAYVGGAVDVRGSIDDPNIDYYQLAYGKDVNPREWISIGGQQTAYNPGTSLGVWETAGLNGVYTLQLSVVFDDGSIDLDTTLVTLDNTAPNIELLAGDGATTIRYPAQTVIPLVANATDNLTINRVEFYQDGQLLGIDREWPYGFEYEITSVGTEIFSAVVFDQVGNNAQADLVIDVIRSG